jgi:DNA-binding NarL/FixJ family response regulator
VTNKATQSERIRILVIDDHPLLRDGVELLLAGQSDMQLVGQASGGREGVEQFFDCNPDVTLMDLQMTGMGGLDAMGAILERTPEARIIVLTTYTGDGRALRAMKLGARAYLTKNLLHKELLSTIRAVHAGRKVASGEVAADIATHFGEEALTDKELDVLRLIAAGNANKTIAAKLGINEETVKSRVKNILGKLHANDRAHAAVIAVKRGIIDP